jgi:hypothetical protein
MFSFIVDYITSRDTSLSLYLFLCHHIVGSEETVKTKRTFNTIKDNMLVSEKFLQITSGSFGEGLEMKGSDIDTMYVQRDVRVYEDINKVPFNSRETSFVMDMDDCKLGFTQLRLVQCNHTNILQLCKQVGNYVYVSNELLKFHYMEQIGLHTIIHGPCVSDMDGNNDFAKCFHSRERISPAHKWIKRPNSSWPSSELKSKIIDHGILFVPIGCKGSKTKISNGVFLSL